MAKLFYQLGGPGLLNVFEDPQVEDQAALQTLLPKLQEIQALSDELRADIAFNGIPSLNLSGAPDLATFDDLLTDEVERVQDILDYFDYDTRAESLTVRDGAWITPEAVESVSHEETGNEATLSIDNDFGSWWQSNDSGVRTIVYRVRGYRKRITGFRVRVPTPADLRSQLQNVTVSAAAARSQINEPSNVLETGINIVELGSAWVEHTLAQAKRARFL